MIVGRHGWGMVKGKSYLWRQTLESKVFRLSETKTEYIRCGFSTITHEDEINLDGQVVPQKSFIFMVNIAEGWRYR
jgi:hypothetical protein